MAMSDHDYAACIYRQVFHVGTDNGDAYTREVLNAIGTLTDNEQAALESYYRHDKNFEQTGQDVGGISGSAARNLVNKALRKLRHESRAHKMSVSNVIHDMGEQLKDNERMITELYRQIERLLLGESVSKKIQAALEERKMKIDELELSSRTNNALYRAGLEKVESILAIDDLYDLTKIRNLGNASLSELVVKMLEHGFDDWALKMQMEIDAKVGGKPLWRVENAGRNISPQFD